MWSHTLGEGEPEVVVVGGIHGDEPCGPEAISRVRSAIERVYRPVEFIVANERALEREQRYIETDLNRTFPGRPDGCHEERLAHELAARVEGKTTLSLHSTQSTHRPFVCVSEAVSKHGHIYRKLPADILIEVGGFIDGTLADCSDTFEVECGLQGTPGAADTAEDFIWAFLEATGVVAGGRNPETPVDVFRVYDAAPKPSGGADFTAENFDRVGAGEAYATVNGEPVRAEEPFYPVLMSSDGYEDIFGYRAEYVEQYGELSASETTCRE